MTLAPKTSPQNTDISETGLDKSALDAIRSILTEETAPAPRSRSRRSEQMAPENEPEAVPARRKADALPDLASAKAEDEAKDLLPKRKFSLSLRRKSTSQTHSLAKPVVKEKKIAAPSDEAGESLVHRIRAYRPSIRHIALAASVLLIIMRPWLFFGLVLFSILLLVGVFLIAGYDGFWLGVVKASRWYAKRRPSRAAALHARMDGLAVRWDAVLDRFPEGTVDGLYLPDFAELATADARHDEAVQRRLAGIHENGA